MHRSFPFSLRSFMIATGLVAVVLGFGASLQGSAPSGNRVWTATAAAALFPNLLIWVNAAALLIERRHQHPQVSKYALIAIGGFLVNWLLGFAVTVLAIQGFSSNMLGGIMMARSVADLLISAVCWWLLFVALLGERELPDDKSQQAS